MDTLLQITKDLMATPVQQINYLRKLSENVEKLRDEVRELYDRRDDVEHQMQMSHMLRKTSSKECKHWLRRVRELPSQINQIEHEYTEDSRYVWGLFPNYCSRFKLGKRVAETIEIVDGLRKKSKFEGGMLVDLPPHIAVPMPGPSIQVETAAGLTLKKIMECLSDDEVGRIGIWGMGGVGKTTILKELNNHPELTQMFEIVIWVTVSRDWSMRNVQKEIAKKLSINIMDDDSHDIVKTKLFASLKDKKFVLLLDDVWEALELLNEVGVPSPTKDNGCKLVFTTRDARVCRWMCTDRDIRVNTMSEDEAWKLFREKAGEVIDRPEIQTIARDVLKKCGGLPLVIIVVGASLRKETDANIWKDAQRELRSSSTIYIDGMEERVFMSLEFSYDRLKCDNIKNCFLYCALFPEDAEISTYELIMYWKAEGLINGIERFKEEHPKGLAMLKKLQESCLLECGSDSTHVKMHDVIRDLALRIAFRKKEGCKFLVRAGVGLTEPPRKEEWKGVERVSLMSNNIKSLPYWPKCTRLSTLLLQNNYCLSAIPDTFFQHMHSLRVLDLSWTGIESLPSSLSKCVNLRSLHLRNCDRLKIGASSNVGGLKSLEVLALSGNEIVDLSSSKIEQLTSLRHLDISQSLHSHQCKIPRGILSRLPLLELLRFGEAEWWDENGEETVKEIASLRNIDSLEMVFPRVEWLDLFVQTRSHLYSDCLMVSHFFLICYGEYVFQ